MGTVIVWCPAHCLRCDRYAKGIFWMMGAVIFVYLSPWFLFVILMNVFIIYSVSQMCGYSGCHICNVSAWLGWPGWWGNFHFSAGPSCVSLWSTHVVNEGERQDLRESNLFFITSSWNHDTAQDPLQPLDHTCICVGNCTCMTFTF